MWAITSSCFSSGREPITSAASSESRFSIIFSAISSDDIFSKKRSLLSSSNSTKAPAANSSGNKA